MSVINAIVSVFSQGQNKPIERYKSRILLSDEHKESLNAFEKHLSDFLGLKDIMRTLGLGQYTLKLYRISKCDGKVENFDISTLPQYKLELPSLLTGESELNGK